MEENKIIIYQTEDGQTQIDVRLENETVWLTQAQMAELFEKTPQNITMHIGNAYKEGELERDSTCKEYLQVQREGKGAWYTFREQINRLTLGLTFKISRLVY
ncbi:MAG: hypothetical protein ACOCM4_15365 [Acetivibrio ethanolgignens]